MRHAIALSALGLGTTSPNPPVGCVILDAHGQVVGAGYHQRKGEPHAEGHALRQAGGRARGGTAVVTLEPCNHAGATPACRQLLLDAGVRRVVIALIDPTSRGEGGAAVLRAAGVDVEVGTLGDEARVVLHPWLTATERRRPFVTLYLNAAGVEDSDYADLRAINDLVVLPDASISEGIPAAHGNNVMTVPAVPFNAKNVGEALVDLHRLGARTVLVVAGSDIAKPLVNAASADRLILDLPRDARAPNLQALPICLPDAFAITNVSTRHDLLRIEAGQIWLRIP